MPPSSPVSLGQLPTFDKSGDINVVIETPKGSRNKYGYDSESGGFRLKGTMPEGVSFPYDFGFFPSTVSEDGDPLDVLIFLDAPVGTGIILTARLIGVIEARQRQGTEEWEQNNRLLAVAAHAHTHDHVHSLDDLRPGVVDEIEQFFGHYNRTHGGAFEPTGRGGPQRARDLLEAAVIAFSASQRQTRA